MYIPYKFCKFPRQFVAHNRLNTFCPNEIFIIYLLGAGIQQCEHTHIVKKPSLEINPGIQHRARQGLPWQEQIGIGGEEGQLQGRVSEF